MKCDDDFALLYGVMLGDGCLSKHKNKKGKETYFISISGNYYEDKPFYDKILLPLLSKIRNKKTVYRERKKYGKIEINFADKILFKKFNEFGFPIGKKGGSLKIPQSFQKDNLMKFIVQGFFATDGSLVLTKNPNKYYPRLEAHGIAPILIRQIKNYLISLGMKGNFYECKRKKYFRKNSQQQYRLQFNGNNNLLSFRDKIGFVNLKHNKRFKDFCGYNENYDKKMKGIPTQKQKFFRKYVKLSGYTES